MNRAGPSFSVAVAMLSLSVTGAPACAVPTELVLVVDTNLAASDLDTIKVLVTGSETRELDVAVNQPGAPAFPLTLGLVPSGANRSVQVSVVATLEGTPVISQTAETTFSDGHQKMLRLLLTDDCVGVTCPSGPPAQTCTAGACGPAEVAASSLPDWSGGAPPRPAPPVIKPIDGRTLWADGWHSCANEGAVLYCWGQNYDGQIGDGTTLNAKTRHPVIGLSNLRTVGLGQVTSCACDLQGQAWCWGRNLEGELGRGAASASSDVPVPVPGLTDCIQIAGGANHTCAVHADHTVSCWGGNSAGQLGLGSSPAQGTCTESDGSTVACVTSPTPVPGLTAVVEVSAGERHTCARKADGTVVCWGLNFDGELGDGTNTNRPSPVPVTGLAADVVQVSCGRWFTCARHAGGTISCWGSNDHGQLGNGKTSFTNHPVQVATLTDAVQIAGGDKHACALAGAGQVWCWGYNKLGQLGDGTGTDSSVPVKTALLAPMTDIAVGSVHSCARAAGGAAFCWGENVVNELGDATTTNRLTPVSVAGFADRSMRRLRLPRQARQK